MKNLILVISFLMFGKLLLSQQECLTIYTNDDIERLPCLEVEIVDSKICVSTYYGGFYIIENDIVTSIDTFNVVLPDIVIRNMSKFSDGLACSYRLGTTTTIYLYDFEQNAFEQIISNEDIIPNDQTNLFSNNIPLSIESKEDVLLIGTTSGLLIYDLDGNYQQIQDLDGDGAIEFVYDIDTESESEAWLCTNSGVFTMDYTTFAFTRISEGNCSQIVVDQNDEVIFTDRITDRLYKYADSGIEEIAQSNAVISFRDVQDFEVDDKNNLIFISLKDVVISEDLDFEKLFDLEEGSRLAVEGDLIVAGGREVIVYECPLTNVSEEIQEQNAFDIYPNAVVNELNVSLIEELHEGSITLSIINEMGVEVLNRKMDAKSLTIEAGQWPAGNYYIILKNANQTLRKSFVKI